MRLSALSNYRKAVFAGVSAVITWVSACYVPDGHITRGEWVTLVIALAGAVGVYGVTNTPNSNPPPRVLEVPGDAPK